MLLYSKIVGRSLLFENSVLSEDFISSCTLDLRIRCFFTKCSDVYAQIKNNNYIKSTNKTTGKSP